MRSDTATQKLGPNKLPVLSQGSKYRGQLQTQDSLWIKIKLHDYTINRMYLSLEAGRVTLPPCLICPVLPLRAAPKLLKSRAVSSNVASRLFFPGVTG